MSIDLLAGIRFFRFCDNLAWSAQNQGDCSWATFSDKTENNLVGLQLGFNLNYCICDRVRLFVTPTVGIYDNYMTSNFGADMIDPNGNHVCGTQSTYPGTTYPVQAHSNDFSFLTQVNVARIGRSRIASVRGWAFASWRRRGWPWPTTSFPST